MKTIRNATLKLAAGCAAIILSACASEEPTIVETTTLERLQATGTIRVGYANEAPFAFRDPTTGRITGEAPEIARVILADLGISDIQGVSTDFGNLIPGLLAGEFDVIAAGMYILPDRCGLVAFTNPTYSIGESFVVAAGNPKSLHSYTDLRHDSTATIGVVAGTVQRGYAREIGIPDSRIIVFTDLDNAIDGLLSGRIDAIAATSLTVQTIVDGHHTPGIIERADPFIDPEIEGHAVRGYGAFAFRPSDTNMVSAFNTRLADFIGSDPHLGLVRPFGFTDSELPGTATAEQLCQRRRVW